MRTSVRFAHDCHNSDSTSGPDGFGLEERSEFIFVVVREGTDDFYQFGSSGDFVFPGDLMDEVIEYDFFSFLIGFDEAGDDF